jgi:hypothetical protein
MKRAKYLGAAAALGALLVAGLLVSPASATAPPTTGTWYFHGPQTYTDTTTTVPGPTAYKSAVRPPINADKSSNFPAKRGVIPVQFDLLGAPTTTTTITRTYDPPVWKSLGSDGSVTYAGLNLSPTLTVNDITNLSATYDFTEGDCFGGSLRWDIYVTHNSVPQVLEVYYGTPNGPDQGCSGSNSGSGDNLITTGITADRFEMLGGWGVVPSYTTYANALLSTNGGADVVTGVQLTLDSGWKGDQRANVSDITVNANTWVPKTTETLSSSTVTGDYVKTCDLPAAELRWAKNDATPTGAINEAESIQPKDAGQFYRQVDCKYIYNLDVSSLSGQGTYTIWVRIDGTNVQVPATFDLR